MIHTTHLLLLFVFAGVATGLSPTASTQSHGLAAKNEFQSQQSVKSLQPQVLGLTDKSHQLDSTASAAAGPGVTGGTKSLALRNGVGRRAVNVKPLRNKVVFDRRPGQDSWETAFDGIQIRQESSQGQLPSDEVFLGVRSFPKRLVEGEESHGFSVSHETRLNKDVKGLQ